MTERTFSAVPLSDVRAGDIIRLTKGDAVVIAPVRQHASYGLYIDVPGLSVSADNIELSEMGDHADITLERADPALPTEPGFYRGRDWGDSTPALGLHLNARGEWRTIWSTGEPTLHTPDSSDLPLIRLTEETSK